MTSPQAPPKTYAPHFRLTMSGAFLQEGGTLELERFALRLNLSRPVFAQSDFTLARATDYKNDCAAWFSRATTRIAGACVLQEVKLASINALGKYTADPFIIGTSTPGGFGLQRKYPPQVSLAVSLVTVRRGATGRGRFYIPGPNADLDGLSGVSSIDALAIRDSTRTLLEDLNNTPGLDGVSPKVVVASSRGYNTDVNGVRVGRVFDTIRSRRSSLLESYSAVGAVA